VLRRGFAAVFHMDGSPITSLGQVVSGQAVRVRLADGRFAAQVTGVDTSPIGNQS
jgi:exonuclease VII large subunit